jgi:putative ABC transport system substrate-binding protein
MPAIKTSKSIPVVFETGSDPVQLGLVPSLNRPAGNLDRRHATERGRSRPQANVVALLVNPSTPALAEPTARASQAAATALPRRR